MKKWAKKMKVVMESPATGDLGGVYTSGSYIFVHVKEGQEHWASVDTIVHEGVHVFQKAMEYIGESATGIEAQAYHTAAIVTNLLKDFNLKNK